MLGDRHRTTSSFLFNASQSSFFFMNTVAFSYMERKRANQRLYMEHFSCTYQFENC